MGEETSAARSWRSRLNNAQGQSIEKEVERACLYYQSQGIAIVQKTPEPFSVKAKQPRGRFIGQFGGAKAQPDFKGVLAGGRTVVFEVKSTQDDRIKQSVLTETQAALLDSYYQMGAIAFICVAVQQDFFTIPWDLWRDMKAYWGRKYVKSSELERYKVRYHSGIMFLDKAHLIRVQEIKAPFQLESGRDKNASQGLKDINFCLYCGAKL